MSKDLYYIDTETGEIEPFYGTVITSKQREVIHSKSVRNAQYADTPTFIWIMFRYGDILFPGMQAANLTRLIYAATFCNGEGKLLPKTELRRVLNLSKDSWASFWNEMMTRDIMVVKDDGYVYVNTKCFTKWSLKPNANDNYTRVYCMCVRRLYESCRKMTDHKRISYIFKIIPFVNRRYNIVCKNPWELDRSKVTPMTLGEFCETLGLDKSNARRVLKEMLKVNVDGVPAVCFSGADLKESTWRLYINPNIYYGGDYGENRTAVTQVYKDLIEHE